jgi:fructan beta-fructosidase
MTKILVGLIIIGLLSVGTVVAQTTDLYREPFRPQYHYSPPCRWINDPNGLVYFDGEYHLFYQFHPDGLTWGPMHWGHAVSADLIHWETLPIALYPDKHGTIFSGSAVIDHNNTAGFGRDAMVAIYSYHTQTQGVAYSLDRGRTWTKYAGNPVIGALAKDFRDPKVFWHDQSGQWIMVIAAGNQVRFFTSPNLLNWTSTGSFAGGHVATVWEVPDLFPLEIEGQTRWVLLVSVNALAPAGGSGTQYFIGDFDGRTFTSDDPATTLWLDYGPDNYAGTTWNNEPNNKRIFIGWMNNWQYAERVPTSPWRGAMTIPREFMLVRTLKGIRLAQTPVASVEQLRKLIGTWDDLSVSGELLRHEVHGRTLEIIADFEPGTARRFGIDVHRGVEGRTRIVYNMAQSQLLISRSTRTENVEIAGFTPAFGAPIDIENNILRLRILVDESSVEVFASEGAFSMTSQTFVNPQNNGIALFADGGTVKVSHLKIYALADVWSKTGNQSAQGVEQCG